MKLENAKNMRVHNSRVWMVADKVYSVYFYAVCQWLYPVLLLLPPIKLTGAIN